MNIRLGDGGVRCRISHEELKSLLAGRKIEERLVLAGVPVLLTVDPSGDGDGFGLVYQEGRIGLTVSPGALRALDQKGRQKAGIDGTAGGTALSLQVDVKTYPLARRG